MKISQICMWLLLSQLVMVGVFWAAQNSYYVINEDQNLCWEFTRWSTTQPNWLPENWEAVFLHSNIQTSFLENTDCLDKNIWECCRHEWYRYAWVSVGVEFISQERRAAEFLASKKYIETKSFNPSKYYLNENISRKEMMKIIMKISDRTLPNECREIFTDVANDWGCKYIEWALENEFISWNQLFRPNDSITKTEALKLIFKARSIEKSYSTGNWQEDYISTAYYHGYIDEKYKNYNQEASRGWIFTVVAKTFEEFEGY